MKVIFGEMESGSFACHGTEEFGLYLVHKVQAVMDLPDEDAADALLSQYDSYVVPSMIKTGIFYAPGAWDAVTSKGEDA